MLIPVQRDYSPFCQKFFLGIFKTFKDIFLCEFIYFCKMFVCRAQSFYGYKSQEFGF